MNLFDKQNRPIRFPLKQVVQALLALGSLAILALVIWGLDKGLDVSDESYYLLGYQAGQEKFIDVSAFQLLVISRLFGFLNNVIAFRVLSVIVTILAAAVFTLGFQSMLAYLYHPARPIMKGWVKGIWFVGASFFWAAAYPLTFSYNVLNNATMLIVTGAVLYLISKVDSPKIGRLIIGWGLATGLILSVSVLVKPPSTLLIVFLGLVMLLVCWLPGHMKLALGWVGSILTGGIVGLFGVLVGLDAWKGFYQTFTVGQILNSGYVTMDIAKRAVVEMQPVLDLIFKYSWILVIVFLGTLFSSHINLSPRIKKCSIAALLVWLAAYLLTGSDFLNRLLFGNLSRMPLIGFFFLALCILLEIIGLNRILRGSRAVGSEQKSDHHRRVKGIALGVYMLVLPFAAALGTNNSHLWQAWLHITPWCALAMLLLQEIEQLSFFRNTAWVVFALLAIWIGGRWINIYLIYPYRLVQNRLSQTEPFPIDTPALRGLKVDPPTRKFYYELKLVANRSHFQPGDEIVDGLESPGMVLALGGFSPGTPWFFANVETGCNAISHSQTNQRLSLFILRNELSSDFLDCLKKQGIDFTNQFSEIGKVESPYARGVVTLFARKE